MKKIKRKKKGAKAVKSEVLDDPWQGLTMKMKKFVMHYCATNNQGESAIAAGYSPHSADQAGCRLMKNPKVKKAIEAQLNPVMEKQQINSAELFEMLGRFVRFNIKDIFEADNNRMRNIHELDDDISTCIAGVKVQEILEKNPKTGKKELVGYTREIKLVDKLKAVEIVSKYVMPAVQQISAELKGCIQFNENVPPEVVERLDALTALTEAIRTEKEENK